MGILDTVFLILLILAALWGFIKGFGKGTVRALANYAGLACGYFFGCAIADAILQGEMNSNPFYNLYLQNLPSTEAFTTSLAGISPTQKTALMSTALSELNIPSLFHGIFTTRALSLEGDVASALASSFTALTITALCFVVLYLVAYIIVKAVLGKITETIFGEDGKSFLGRVAGLVKKVVSVSGMILSLFVVVLLVNNLLIRSGNTTLNDFFVSDLHLNDGNYVSLSRIFYNTAGSFMNWVQSI